MVRIVDLSEEIYHRSPSNPGQPPTILGTWITHEEALARPGRVQGNEVKYLILSDHATTHIDAPRHFNPDGVSIDCYPLECCYVMGICLDLRHVPDRGEITVELLREAVERAGAPIPSKGTVLLCTGFHARAHGTPSYFTDNPGVTVEATRWIASQGAVHFGIDSYRPGPGHDHINDLVHKTCGEINITHMEGLCNLEELLGRGQFRFIGLPLKIRGGTGSPMRAIAVLDE